MNANEIVDKVGKSYLKGFGKIKVGQKFSNYKELGICF